MYSAETIFKLNQDSGSQERKEKEKKTPIAIQQLDIQYAFQSQLVLHRLYEYFPDHNRQHRLRFEQRSMP